MDSREAVRMAKNRKEKKDRKAERWLDRPGVTRRKGRSLTQPSVHQVWLSLPEGC